MVVEYANYLQSKGYDVVISANLIDTVFDVKAKVEQISGRKNKAGTIIDALLRKRDYDVIIADIIVMIFFLSLRNRRRLLYFSQDYDEEYYKNNLMKMFIRLVYFFCLRIMKIPVIAVSYDLGRFLRNRFKANVTVVPNGIDTDIFYPDRDEKYLALKGNTNVVLVFARSDYRKGFDIALRVLEKFRKDINAGKIRVWAVGEDLAFPFEVTNFGFVSPEDLRKILSCSDALLYPSRHEGLPLFVLEAMACGCPVVTTEAVRFLKRNKNYVICDIMDAECLNDTLRSLLFDPQFQNKIRKEGYEVAMQYRLRESRKLFKETIEKYGSVRNSQKKTSQFNSGK